MKMILTLCIVKKEGKILLGMKKRGFGAGRWNGFGGKLHEGETIEECIVRELKEESNLQALESRKIGILDFEFENNNNEELEVHIFLIEKFTGEPQESEEMTPKWFNINDIPYEQMWSDDQHWIPLLLDGKKFKGKFLFDRPSNKEYSAKIIEQELLEVDKL